jgi:hypothetical protein
VRKLLSDGFGIVACLHRGCLALDDSQVPYSSYEASCHIASSLKLLVSSSPFLPFTGTEFPEVPGDPSAPDYKPLVVSSSVRVGPTPSQCLDTHFPDPNEGLYCSLYDLKSEGLSDGLGECPHVS